MFQRTASGDVLSRRRAADAVVARGPVLSAQVTNQMRLVTESSWMGESIRQLDLQEFLELRSDSNMKPVH